MKQVLAITDSYRWATYFRAINLKKNLKNYNFHIVSFHDIIKVGYEIDFNKFDIVYILNWPIYGYVKHKILKNRKYKLVTGISSHIGRPDAKEMRPFFSKFESIGVSNKFLYREFKRAKIKGVVYTPFGVNHNLFKKTTNPNDYRHIFGWVGSKERSVKRYREIKRAFAKLGSKYKLKTVDNKSKYSREKMVKFYNSIGTLICYSESEGTPNPVLEAAMCGRAIISSNVGNVPQLMTNVSGFEPVSSFESLVCAIKKHGDKVDLDKFGSKIEGLALKDWTWEIRSKNFIKLLE